VQSAPVVNLSSNFGLVDWVPGLLYVGAYGQETVATLESVRQLRPIHNQSPANTCDSAETTDPYIDWRTSASQ